MNDIEIDLVIVFVFSAWFLGYGMARKIWYGKWFGYKQKTQTQESKS